MTDVPLAEQIAAIKHEIAEIESAYQTTALDAAEDAKQIAAMRAVLATLEAQPAMLAVIEAAQDFVEGKWDALRQLNKALDAAPRPTAGGTMTARPIDPSLIPDDVPEARNDSSVPTKVVLAKLKADGVEIRYGDLIMLAQRSSLEEARLYIAKLPVEERQGVMRSVDKALRGSLQKVSMGTASKKRMDNFHHDLLLWTVLKELSL